MSNSRAACVGHEDWFGALDIEDSEGNLLAYHWPYEAQAKALCAACPVRDWCAENYWALEGVIVAGRRDDERKGRRRRGRE